MRPSFFAVGICVRDMDRSTRFYTEVLNAELDLAVDLPAELRGNHCALTEVPDDMSARTRFLNVGGSTVELLHYTRLGGAEACSGDGQRRPMNLRGLTHLSYQTASREHAETIIGRVARYGGTVVEGARLSFRKGEAEVEIQFVLDPDGTRIEIVFDNGLGPRRTTS